MISIPILDFVQRKQFPYIPPNIPKDFAQDLNYATGEPLAFWIGNIFSYFLNLIKILNKKFKVLKKKYSKIKHLLLGINNLFRFETYNF